MGLIAVSLRRMAISGHGHCSDTVTCTRLQGGLGSRPVKTKACTPRDKSASSPRDVILTDRVPDRQEDKLEKLNDGEGDLEVCEHSCIED